MSGATASEMREVPAPAKESLKRSKSRLRELAAEVDQLQDQLSELDLARAAKQKEVAAKIREWNSEAAKRK
jgi:hypothetical protein